MQGTKCKFCLFAIFHSLLEGPGGLCTLHEQPPSIAEIASQIRGRITGSFFACQVLLAQDFVQAPKPDSHMLNQHEIL